MNISFIRIAAVCAVVLGSASCVNIDETLGGNFMPTDQIWDVYPCEAVSLDEGITMGRSDSLSAYSTSRFTFGAVKDENFVCSKSTSFPLVPLADSLDFGEETEILQFHFTAVRDTLSMLYDRQERILQNVYACALKQPLDSTTLYTGTFARQENVDKFLDLETSITKGTPIYNGGDSLSFDFTEAYALKVIDGIKEFQKMDSERRDTISNYLTHVPGIYIWTDEQTENGGRINMFNLPIEAESGYLTGNYAELKIRAKYDYSDTPVDTSFIFYFGPSRFLTDDDTSYPTQYAFNASINTTVEENFLADWENGTDKDKVYIEGGSGLKPVIKAEKIKSIAEGLMREKGIMDESAVVINKATIILPYDVNGDYALLDKYPGILSPTVKLYSDDGRYVTYAGLTDSSIETENQGDINRSTSMYSPDISHHVQEIVKLERGKGEDVNPDETEEQFKKRLSKYDIWMLIMHEEITETSSGSSYDDYYNNLLYNSYYNNMMYDPYGYGYGYGGYGYGYGYDSYGYNNYYNYYMMAQYANASSSSTTTSSSIELDRDRFYNATLNGPTYQDENRRPCIKITFSAPKSAE